MESDLEAEIVFSNSEGQWLPINAKYLVGLVKAKHCKSNYHWICLSGSTKPEYIDR